MTPAERRIERACKALKHCDQCRHDNAHRIAIGMPEVCPPDRGGWTKDNLPEIPPRQELTRRCPFAGCTGCGQPTSCSLLGADCTADPLDIESCQDALNVR